MNPVRPEPVEGLSGIYGVHPAGEGEETSSCFDWALKKQLFYAYKINYLQAHKKLQNRVKQRLFHGNAMRPKGGLLCSARTSFFTSN
jgi:hypothetical protein